MVILSKDVQKTIARADKKTAIKFQTAITKIENGTGDIIKLKPIKKGMGDNLYRLKMEHYRIIFERSHNIVIKSITTKTNTKFKRTGCM